LGNKIAGWSVVVGIFVVFRLKISDHIPDGGKNVKIQLNLEFFAFYTCKSLNNLITFAECFS